MEKWNFLLHTDQQSIRRIWQDIEPGVAEVIGKTRPGFISADVYVTCMSGHAMILCTYAKDGSLAGHVVLGQEADGFTSSKTLMIWTAFSKVPGAALDTMPVIDSIAKERGYDYITMHSPRKGWLRHAESLGFKLREHVFARKVT